MQRTIFRPEHDRFRSLVEEFYGSEVAPRFGEWEAAGRPPRQFWRRAGELGLLSCGIPRRFGGEPERDFRYNAILTESAQAAGLALGGLRVQTDICLPYLLEYADDDQQAAWLPRLAAGDAVVALAISEPGAGSDVASIATGAVRDGDDFVVNGSKTFISNGISADLVILAVRTGSSGGKSGLSLLLVDTASPGFERGRNLEKIGLKGQDLAELYFRDMRVPATALLGRENAGFTYLTANLAQERLSIAINSQASAAAVLAATRAIFAGARNSQDVKFSLAGCQVQVAAGQALIDQAITAHLRRALSAADAAAVKLFCTEMQSQVIDRCLQLGGLEHYTRRSPIGRGYTDSRVSRVYGGTSEIMRVIVAKSMGL